VYLLACSPVNSKLGLTPACAPSSRVDRYTIASQMSLVADETMEPLSLDTNAADPPGRVTRQRPQAAANSPKLPSAESVESTPRSPRRTSSTSPIKAQNPPASPTHALRDEEDVAMDLASLAMLANFAAQSEPPPSLIPSTNRLSSLSPQRSLRSVIQQQGLFAPAGAPATVAPQRSSKRTKKPTRPASSADDEYLYFDDSESDAEYDGLDTDEDAKEVADERRRIAPRLSTSTRPAPRRRAAKASGQQQSDANAKKRKRASAESSYVPPAVNIASTALTPAIQSPPSASTPLPSTSSTSPTTSPSSSAPSVLNSSRRHPPTTITTPPSSNKRQKLTDTSATLSPPTIAAVVNPTHVASPPPASTSQPPTVTTPPSTLATSPSAPSISSRAHTELLAAPDKLVKEISNNPKGSGGGGGGGSGKRQRASHPTTLETLIQNRERIAHTSLTGSATTPTKLKPSGGNTEKRLNDSHSDDNELDDEDGEPVASPFNRYVARHYYLSLALD